MNKECCKKCVKEHLELESEFTFGEKTYRGWTSQEAFDDWFEFVWQKYGKKSPCRWLTAVEGETEPQFIEKERYGPLKIDYHFVIRTIAPEDCPYLLEHTVSSC